MQDHVPPDVSFLQGGGEVGALLRGKDWSGHPFGEPATWPQSLRTMVAACINSPAPGAVLWGPELRLVYNDGYTAPMQDRHPGGLGEPVAQVWGDAWNLVAHDFHRVLATGEGVLQRRIALPIERGGQVETTYWDFTATPIRREDGCIGGLFNQGAEITTQVMTEQRRDAAETELRALTAQLSNAVEERTRDRNALWSLSTDLMLRCGFDGRIVAVNPAWTEVLGWPERELLGASLFDLLHPEDRDHTVRGADASAAGEKFAHFTNRYRHQDGSYRSISWSTRPADGLINAVGRDVTGERAQREALQASQEQLRQSQKLEALGQLTGGIAHDFNNLLTIVSTSIQLLQKPRLPEERRQRFMSAISSAVTRAARLTSQLLAFARRQTLQPVVFDVPQNVSAIGDMVRTLVGSRIDLQTDAPDPGCIVDADPGQFDTAIVNLCANARDAMEGVGKLVIRTCRVSGIPPRSDQPGAAGEFVAVAVEDSGCGISAEDVQRVFEPFFTTKKVGQGTGLGLSQVFGFARQSGGDVQIDSVVGQGTTFTLYLPLARREAAKGPDPSVHKGREPEPAGRVLLVEDNVEVASAVEASLSELGYEVVWAAHAEQALQLLADPQRRFLVVFSDVVMPGIDGVAMAREMRKLHPRLPVLLSSGYSNVLASSVDLEFPLLAKPYSLDSLALGLRDAINQRALELGPEPIVGIGEEARLAALAALGVMDTDPEKAYDDVTRLVATLFDAPMALVSLVDAERQWFKSRQGMPAQQTPRDQAFCAHAIEHPDEVMVVPDASLDPRFAENPLVTGGPTIRFYAGAPLVTSTGHALGTLCVLDTRPRQPDPSRLEALKMLAAQVVERLEARRPKGG